jgi:hypothetical protein
MRTALLCLVGLAVCTIASAGCARVRVPTPAPAAKPEEQKAKPNGLAWQIKGWGRTQQEAEEDGVKRASEFLGDVLQHQKPPLAVTPPPAYLRKHLIRWPAQRREDLDQAVAEGPDKIKMQCWTLSLAVTPEDYQDLVRLDRQMHHEAQRSERMLLFAKLAGGVLALLAVVLAYLRLEAWMKRACTRRVRLALACFLVVAVVGLLFFA